MRQTTRESRGKGRSSATYWKGWLLFLASFLTIASLHPVAQPTNDAALFTAVKLGYVHEARELLRHGANVNARDHSKVTPIQWAAYEGNLRMVKLLVTHGADPRIKGILQTDRKDTFYGSALAAAAGCRHDRIVRFLLNRCHVPVNDKELAPDGSESGWTALQYAAYTGNDRLWKYLFSKGADDRVLSPDGRTMVELAIQGDSLPILRLALAHGGSATLQDRAGFYPLNLAAFQGDVRLAKLLVKSGASVNQPARDGVTPLLDAARTGHSKMWFYLISIGARYTDVDKKGHTMAGEAAFAGCNPILRYLIAHESVPNETTKNGAPPLSIAAWKGHLSSVRLLVKAGANVNTVDRYGATPLTVAVRWPEANLGVVRYLLDHGAKCTLEDAKGRTALDVALWWGSLPKAKLLVSRGADLSHRTREGMSMLMAAVHAPHGAFREVKWVLSHGADVNAQTDQGYTALMLAALDGRARCTEVLLRAGAKVSVRSKNGFSPLMVAAVSAKDNPDVVTLLLNHGASLGDRVAGGMSPLMLAAEQGNIKVARLLLAKGDQLEWRDKDLDTPLLIAARSKISHPDMVALLLKAGADVKTADKWGYTSLHWAAYSGHFHLVETLLNAGAPVEARDESGSTPLILAAHGNKSSPDLLQLLLNRGANILDKDNQGRTALDWAIKNHNASIVDILQSAYDEAGAGNA